ncbi:MAG: elongation factor P [Gemmatimonadetes bacterium]|nr:MAG: elongation factor P [Gemmatimonadota bacterium]
MASTSDFRNGFSMRWNGEIWSIVEFQHVKPGKGGAFVRTKLKNLKTGRVLDNTFRAGEKVEEVRVERRKKTYLYNDGHHYIVMDEETYEQTPMTEDYLKACLPYLKENMELSILESDGEILAVEVPTFVELEITKTEPGVRGDTATGGTKPAIVETGATIQVPLFLNAGDVIRVDTRTGEYMERVSAA